MRRATALALVTAAGLVLAGCSAGNAGPAPSSTPSPTPTIATTLRTDLAAGDCYDTVDTASVELVECTESHGFEVFASLVLPDGDYSTSGIETTASDRCRSAFASFIGIVYDESALTLRYLAPSRTTWELGDREVLCVVFDPRGRTTGSLAETAR